MQSWNHTIIQDFFRIEDKELWKLVLMSASIEKIISLWNTRPQKELRYHTEQKTMCASVLKQTWDKDIMEPKVRAFYPPKSLYRLHKTQLLNKCAIILLMGLQITAAM